MATFYGTNAGDLISYDTLSGDVTSDPPGLTSTTTSGDLIHGYGGNDTVDGSEGYDTVFGGDGSDIVNDTGILGAAIHGEAGNDYLTASAAAYFDGGNGNDTVASGYDSGILIGGHGTDFLYGNVGKDTLFGGAGADYLKGEQNADFLRGGAGDDTLMGGEADTAPAKDTLIGGTGDDTFVFLSEYLGAVVDFTVIRGGYGTGGAPAFEGAGVAGGDVIDLSGMDSNLTISGNQQFNFGGKGIGHLWLTEIGTRTVVLADLYGDASAEFKLVIVDEDVRASDYTADDFIL